MKDDKKKVVLLQIDYDNYAFNSGKEFSYFLTSSNATTLPIDSTINSNFPNTRITMQYGDSHDTIFDGTEVFQGTGFKSYPANMDSQIFYYRIDNPIAMPDTSVFQLAYYDLGTQAIPYDSIWKGISKLQLVEQYRTKNPTSKIGLFLFRPSYGISTADWKWYVIMRD